MLRNNLFVKNNKNDLYFQITDWTNNDLYLNKKNEEEEEEEEEENKYKKKQRRLIIRGYGVTNNGNSISIHIFNFKPYFYIKIPENWTDKEFKLLKKKCLNMIPEYNHEGLDEARMILKKEFYEFINNKLFKYGLFKFKNQGTYYAFLKNFKEKEINIQRLNEVFDFSKKIYETKVNPLIRFFHNNNLDPSMWLQIKAHR